MSPEQLEAAVQVTLQDIDEELSAITPLLKQAEMKELDFIETAAAAQIMQSVYTGIEKLCLFILKRIDGTQLEGGDWHRRLLNRMTEASTAHSPVFSEETRERLEIYLDFRHLVRNQYARSLKSARVGELLIQLPAMWAFVRKDLSTFIMEYRE